VPISAKLAGFIKRYIATSRPSEVPYQEILISRLGRPFTTEGVKSLMERLKRRAGFRVHGHALRHTYATASVQLDVNLEKLRADMGHEEYEQQMRWMALGAQLLLQVRSRVRLADDSHRWFQWFTNTVPDRKRWPHSLPRFSRSPSLAR